MRYVITFKKEGYIKYTSHLDLLRLFKRSFKRVGIKLQYSQGFNPHPKMSFAQPLSLGYTSSCEYLEFDTVEPVSTLELKTLLNSVMPEGVEILSCEELEQGGKTLAALTDRASYEIKIPLREGFPGEKALNTIDLEKLLSEYQSQDNIMITKRQKKSGKDIELDLKPMIKEIKGEIYDKYIMLTCMISAGSAENLSPEMVLSTFCRSAGIEYDRSEVQIKRTGIYFSNHA